MKASWRFAACGCRGTRDYGELLFLERMKVLSESQVSHLGHLQNVAKRKEIWRIGVCCVCVLLAGVAGILCVFNCAKTRAGIYPKVARAFGEVVNIQATISFRRAGPPPIPKAWEDFYEIEVLSVGGKKLTPPAVMECRPFNVSGVKDRSGFEKLKTEGVSKRLSVTGYEIACMKGLPEGLGQVLPSDEMPCDADWHVHHVFVVLEIEGSRLHPRQPGARPQTPR